MLEVSFAPKRNEQGQTPAGALRERRCRRIAKERGVPYEQVLGESLIEREAFMAYYDGNGSISDILRYSRRCRFEAAAAAQKTAQGL